MNIVFLARRELADPWAGGSEVVTDRLAEGLTTRGHDVEVIAGGPVGHRPYAVRSGGGAYSQFVRAPLTAARRCRQADLVVDVCNGLSFMAPLWHRGPTISFVHHVHREMWPMWFNPVVANVGWFLESRVMPAVHRRSLFVTVSPSSADALAEIGVDPANIRVVYNGVDLPTALPKKRDQPQFLALGRMVPHKRFDLLLEAWDRVRDRTGGKLVLAGDGPDRAHLEAIAGPGVEFRGFVSESEKSRLLAESMCQVVASSVEGWGLVVMEAAAHGTPTVAYDAPGIRDAIVDQVTGLLATSPEQFDAQWVSMARNAPKRERLAAAARVRAEALTWDRTVDDFLNVAREAMGMDRIPPTTPSTPYAPLVESSPDRGVSSSAPVPLRAD